MPLSGILVIDIDDGGSFTDPVDFLFDCALLVPAFEEDAVELDDPIAVVVIDSELLIKFCCNPDIELELEELPPRARFFSDSKYFFS